MRILWWPCLDLDSLLRDSLRGRRAEPRWCLILGEVELDSATNGEKFVGCRYGRTQLTCERIARFVANVGGTVQWADWADGVDTGGSGDNAMSWNV